MAGPALAFAASIGGPWFPVIGVATAVVLIAAKNSDIRRNRRNSRNVHTGVTCDECGQKPIIGHRFKCSSCDNYDLCNTCHEQIYEFSRNEHSTHYDLLHQFIEIKKPGDSGEYYQHIRK